MRSFFCLLLALTGALILPACSHTKDKAKDKPAADTTPKPLLVGIVEMVNPEQNYVLLRSELNYVLSPGTELIAVDATGAQSKLKLTPERKGRFLTADIKEGQPRVMNLVIKQPAGAAANAPLPFPTATAAQTPAAPQPSPQEINASMMQMTPFPALPGDFLPMPMQTGPLPDEAGHAPALPQSIQEPAVQ